MRRVFVTAMLLYAAASLGVGVGYAVQYAERLSDFRALVVDAVSVGFAWPWYVFQFLTG